MRGGCWLLLGMLAFLLGATGNPGDERGVDSEAPFEFCSIVNLIATPDSYDGQRIRTEGVATIGFEQNAIYLSTESAAQGAKVNGIGLALTDVEDLTALKEKLHMKWVLVEGVYHRWTPGESGRRGYIDEVSLLYALEDVEVQ